MKRIVRLFGLAAVTALLPALALAQYIGGSAPLAPTAPFYAESAGAALARHVRVLAGNPRNYDALIGAGRAALATGDPEAAIGFYGRAEEVNPGSWVPKIGQGAALLQMMDSAAALSAFSEAQRLGASQLALALERGLAFDLMGDQARAQNDFRVALGGADPSEARRRLALSQAISGRRADALATLDPLLARRDPGAIRARAFVLAMTGDADGARSAVNAALPGLAGTMDPFLRRLPSLRPAEKAAAVHFGVMPGGSSTSGSAYQVADSTPTGDRLGEIDQFLRAPPPPAAGPVPGPYSVEPSQTRLSATTPVVRAPVSTTANAAIAPRRVWLQLASGTDTASLSSQFRRITGKDRDLFRGLSGFVAEEGGRARLLIGPFKSSTDAKIFAEDLASLDIDAFSWTSQPGQQVRKLPPQ